MKRIKNILENDMLHNILSSLNIIIIEKSEEKWLNIDDTIKTVVKYHKKIMLLK